MAGIFPLPSVASAMLRRSCQRTVCRSRHALPSSSRWMSAAAETAAATPTTPTPPTSSLQLDPKINQLVDDISALSLLQAADLISALKSRLNIQEIAMPSAAAPAPAAPVDVEEETAKAAPKEKTIFNLTLQSFDAGSKAKIIREVKALNTSLTLIEAKKWVDSVPKVLKESVPKEEAEQLKKKFEELGAVIAVE